MVDEKIMKIFAAVLVLAVVASACGVYFGALATQEPDFSSFESDSGLGSQMPGLNHPPDGSGQQEIVDGLQR